jgi:hypothetical protein
VDALAVGLSGDVVVTLLPRELLPSVLEPLARRLAARARFSLERSALAGSGTPGTFGSVSA